MVQRPAARRSRLDYRPVVRTFRRTSPWAKSQGSPDNSSQKLFIILRVVT